MAATRSRPKLTQTHRDMKTYLFTFFATLSGVIVGVVAGVGMMGQVVKTQVATATDGLRQDLSSMKLASNTIDCTEPSGVTAATASVVTSAKPSQPVAPPAGGRGGGEEGGKGTWIRYINTIVSDTKGDISNTGQDSTNIVKSVNKNTTTTTNTNVVTAVNNNNQKAESGSVESEKNTTAGTSTSGDAQNDSSATFRVEFKN